MHQCEHEGCSRTYSSQANLLRHMRIQHSGVQRFKCPYCEKTLATAHTLKEHIYLHTGESPYVCTEPHCSVRFRQASQLSAHKKQQHSRANTYASFKELKVTDIQLTDLLRTPISTEAAESTHYPERLSEHPPVQLLRPLPLVTFQPFFGPLPNIFHS